MAKLRKKSHNSNCTLREKAFDMFIKVDHNFERIFTYQNIAEKLNIPVRTLYTWNSRHKWQKLLDKAIARAKARASKTEDMQKLLTDYLVQEEDLLKKRRDNKKAKQVAIRNLKREKLEHALKNIPDVLYEIRAYNHRMFRKLMDEGHRLSAREREVLHRAWKDSLDSLLDTFGVSNIKDLAAEKLSMEIPHNKTESSAVNINIQNNNPLNTGQIVLSADAHELIMKTMTEKELIIDGPIEYLKHKEQGSEGIEEAIVTE